MREAAERECACRGAIRLPDEQSEEPCEARSQEAAREPKPSEFLSLGAVSESKRTSPPRGGRDFVLLIDNSQSLRGVNARIMCVYFWKRQLVGRAPRAATSPLPKKRKNAIMSAYE